MSGIDRNKIFFGLIHYVLSEQSNVDWILKTSLVNFTGINSSVDNKKYKQSSLTNDIIEYIYQVKPYHVMFEQFIEKYSSQDDEVEIKTSDLCNLTMVVRYDALTTKVDAQGSMDDYEYMNTHMANRLWLMKHKPMKEIYGNDDEIHNYIKDVMNGHFKGITVDGSKFNIDTAGYDAFLYDSSLYDAPTLTADYCIIDKNEPIHYEYQKQFTNIGLKSFKLISDDIIYPDNLKIYSEYEGIKTEITSFVLKDNLLTLFKGIRKFEKITIINTVNHINNAYIFVGHPFNESMEDSNIRQFVQLGENRFRIPATDINSSKVTVHIEYPNGSRIPTTNFTKSGDDIIIKNELKENYHVIVTVIDYKHLYDKIYSYEDCYGQSNNLISLEGGEFLRPQYEAERPSESCFIQPYNTLMIYTYRNKKANHLYGVNFKNDQYKMVLNQSLTTSLTKDLNIGDKEIYVDNIEKINLPKKTNMGDIIPGKILVNSEIIEFYDYEILDGNKGLLKSVRRGIEGSYLAQKHNQGSIVYVYNDNVKIDSSSLTISNSYQIFDINDKTFKIPGIYNRDYFEIYYKKNINLLSDINLKSTYFDIDSDNIVLPGDVHLKSAKKFVPVKGNQSFNLTVGDKNYNIKNDKQIDSILELKELFRKSVGSEANITVNNSDGYLELISKSGQAIRLINDEGMAIQEMFGDVSMSDKDNIEIHMDGYNGLKINNKRVYWGNYKHSIQWLKDNPSIGNIDEVINSINSIDGINDIVKAIKINGKLVLIPLVAQNIVIENITNAITPIDNKFELGIDSINIQNIMINDINNKLNYVGTEPDKLGSIFMNGENIHYKNIQKKLDKREPYWRISNFFINREYKAKETEILSVQPIKMDKINYIINEDNTVTILSDLNRNEILILSNKK